MEKQMSTVYLRGFFTTQRWLQGQTLREIEQRLGLYNGRLSQGAWFATVIELPRPDDFEFAGYSQVAGHHTLQMYGNLNSRENQEERANYLQRQLNIINSEWSLYGDKRLIKVISMLDHSIMMSYDFQYPPGSGIPQWKIIAKDGVRWKGICFVKDYPNGRFIPDQGYNPVRYI
jgi:hypothetical protein